MKSSERTSSEVACGISDKIPKGVSCRFVGEILGRAHGQISSRISRRISDDLAGGIPDGTLARISARFSV